MKQNIFKLLLVSLILLTMVGCSKPQENTKEAIKTCRVSYQSTSVSIKAIADSEESEIKDMEISAFISFLDAGLSQEDIEAVKETVGEEEFINAINETLKESLGIEKGIEFKESKVDGTGARVTMSVDVPTMKELAGTDLNEDLSLKSFVSSMENSGFTCE